MGYKRVPENDLGEFFVSKSGNPGRKKPELQNIMVCPMA